MGSQANISGMPKDALQIEGIATPHVGQRVLRLTGPLMLTTLFQFQSLVRADTSRHVILDFTNVPYVDSAGIGALVGAYASHQKQRHTVGLVGVNERVRNLVQGHPRRALFPVS
jgi:anti-anti-sigma factor